MQHLFHRTYETFAIYRLLEPMPVTIDWPTGSQTFEAIDRDYPPYGALEIRGPDRAFLDRPFQSSAHVRHTLANGFKVKVPSIENTFFARLIRDGRAEVIRGPYMEIYWLDQSVPRGPEIDAYYTFHDRKTTGNI